MGDAGSKVPVFQEYMNPTLHVLREERRAVPIEELDRLVVDAMRLDPELAKLPHDPERPDRSEVSYRIAWARTYLKVAGLIDNPQRGKWALTSNGSAARTIDAYALAADVASRTKKKSPEAADSIELETDSGDGKELDEELSAARVSDELGAQLRRGRAELELAGELLSAEQASAHLERFRALFGPEALARLDGEALLQRMHARGRGESLVYWLEFKNDEEFPARFGSVGGGSALKFGIYIAAESGHWMTGSPSKQERLSPEQALIKVRGQRDQMLAGARVLAALPRKASDIDYVQLQQDMVRAAPDLAETSWGHKYFALLNPEILEPFHGADYQQYQLYKLMKVPGSGRYENARIFAGVAEQLEMSLLDLGAVLNRRNGGPHAYWREGTTVGVGDLSEWERMAAGGFASVGWDTLGDLSDITPDKEGKDTLRARMASGSPRA